MRSPTFPPGRRRSRTAARRRGAASSRRDSPTVPARLNGASRADRPVRVVRIVRGRRVGEAVRPRLLVQRRPAPGRRAAGPVAPAVVERRVAALVAVREAWKRRVPGPGAADVDPWSREVDGRRSAVREVGDRIARPRRGDTEDVRRARRRAMELARIRLVVVARVGIEVPAAVPCREREEGVRARGVRDGVGDRLAELRRTEASVDDVGAVVAGVLDGVDDVRVLEAPGRVRSPHRHDRYVPVDARDAGAVVAFGADRAGDVSAVAVEVERRVVVLDEVPAADVVNEPVAVVVGRVPGRLVRVRPDVVVQVRVPVGDAAVDDGDHHPCVTGRLVPGRGCVDVLVRGLAEAPELTEHGVVRQVASGPQVVRLRVEDVGILFERGRCFLHRGAARKLDQREARHADVACRARPLDRERGRPLRSGRAAAEADEQLTRDVARAALGPGEWCELRGGGRCLARPGSRDDPENQREHTDQQQPPSTPHLG